MHFTIPCAPPRRTTPHLKAPRRHLTHRCLHAQPSVCLSIHPVSITRFPLTRLSPGSGLLRNPFFHRSLRFSRVWVPKDGKQILWWRPGVGSLVPGHVYLRVMCRCRTCTIHTHCTVSCWCTLMHVQLITCLACLHGCSVSIRASYRSICNDE